MEKLTAEHANDFVVVDITSGTVLTTDNIVVVNLNELPAFVGQDFMDNNLSDSEVSRLAAEYGQPLYF